MPGSGNLPRDDNHIAAIGGIDNSTSAIIAPYIDHTTKRLLVDADITVDSIVVPTPGIGLLPYDYVSYTNTNTTTDTYTFKSGGAGGTTTNTVVIVYTDTTKSQLSSVTKT